MRYGGIAAKIYVIYLGVVRAFVKLLSSVLPAQESYACDVEGVDADFLLLMAGVVKSGVCSKARYGMGVGTRRTV